MSQLALQRISENKRIQHPALDLSNCELTELPKELFELTHLQSLDLSSNWLSDVFTLTELINLQSIDLSRNRLNDISTLAGLINLQSLNLSKNQLKDVAALNGLINLKSIDLSYSKFRHVSTLNGLVNLQSINLSGNNISNIADLVSLTNLQSIDLSYCQFKNVSALTGLVNLQSVNLSSNNISNISALAGLTNLQSIDLSINSINNISALAGLINLQSLNLSRNNISDVSALAGLINLQSLNLSRNELKDIAVLAGLINLQSLDLRSNQIKEVAALANLTNLQSLDLRSNQIKEVAALANLTNLQSLDLRSNQIKDIAVLAGLINLQSLDLRSNQIKDIAVLAGLTNLQSLDLRSNQIKEVAALADLTNLQSLDLRFNNLDYFDSRWLDHFTSLSSLFLSQNSIQNIPQEILSSSPSDNCLADVRNFFKEKDFEELFETKLILVGNGMVGKTCLADRLVHNTFTGRSTEDRTHGILIKNWKYEDFQLNVWDFGGQDMYHTTHRLFFTQRAMYLLVWAKETLEKPTEEYYELAYWLDYIRDLGAESKIIIVQNQCDLHGELDIFGKEELRTAYPITHIRSVSAKQGKGISALKEAITENLQKLEEGYVLRIPSKWLKVKRELEKYQAQKSISYEAYLELCKKVGLTGTSHATLITYLHNSGFLYYKAELFNNQIILDQMWAIEAVYEVFHPKKLFKYKITNNQGRFTKDYLEEIWENYSTKEREVFLNFMLGAELCFALEANWEYETKAAFVIPQLLPEDNGVLNSWDAKDALVVKYQHRFLHKGIMERFIARTHQLAGEHNFWKNGILLSDKSRQTQSLITFKKGPESNQLTIRVKGKKQKHLLDTICNEFESLNTHQEIEKWVSLDGIYFVSWKVLETKYRKGNREIDAQDGTTLSVSDFAPFMGERTETTISEEIKKDKSIHHSTMYKHVFISYRTKDRDQVKVIQQHFPADVQFKIDYQDIDAGARLTTSIKQMVRDSDVTVFVVSENSLSSAWCMMEFLETSKHEEVNQHKRYIAVCLDHSFLDREANLKLLDIANNHLEEMGRLITEVKKKGGRADDLEEEEKLWYEFKVHTGLFLQRLKSSLVLDFSTEERMKENMPKLLAAITNE